MKLLLLIIASIPYCLFGQITLTNLDFSDGGDVLYISSATDPTIDFLTSGANQSWDFSSLISTGQTVKEYATLDGASFLVGFSFGAFAGVDYQATNFTASNALPLDQLSQFLPVDISNVSQFSKNSVNSITSVGLSMTVSGTEIPFKSDTIESRYILPLNFGDIYDSRGYSNVDMNPVYNGIWRQYRQRHSEVDGWGTVTAPFGVFDVLRIHHIINETDSLFIDIFGTGTWIELPIPVAHQYEWIAVGEKEPVFRISTSEIGGIETVTTIEYKNENLSASLKELSNDFQLFPNPANEKLQVSGIKTTTKYSIYNLVGKKMKSGILSPENNSLIIEGLSEGKYLLEIVVGDTVSVISFIKK